MRTPSRALAGTTTALVAAVLVLAPGAGGNAAPGIPASAGPAEVHGDDDHPDTIDNRKGRIAPTAKQRTLAADGSASARWNIFGTP
ncbi:MAG TPA: hypothetical protein VN408_29240, partial [Actinoplanes sp.]|nr:hypothetical protein [Actinoplanes sp.]